MARWRQCRKTGKLIPIDEAAVKAEGNNFVVKGKFDAYCSPVDGTVIRNAKDLEEHNKRNDVVLMDEFGTDHWKSKAKEREKFFKGEHTTREVFERKQQINSIIDRATENERRNRR